MKLQLLRDISSTVKTVMAEKVCQISAIIGALFFVAASASFAAPLSSIAFFYGGNPPINELNNFNAVVMQPYANVSPRVFTHATPYAYVAASELNPKTTKIPKAWILGQNSAWHTDIMDLANPAWRTYLLNKEIGPLWKRGYRGFFLDTLDSYQQLNRGQRFNHRQELGLIAFIKAIKKSYPQAKIILNRGFPIIHEVRKDITAVAVESLFKGWNEAAKKYVTVPASERRHMTQVLQRIKSKYHLPIIVIDYVNPINKVAALAIVKKIKKLGFIPWVSNGALDILGHGAISPVSRKVLIIYQPLKRKGGFIGNSVFRQTAVPLEYMGYTPRYISVESELPEYPLDNRVSGIIVWLNNVNTRGTQKLAQWLQKQNQHHIPLLLLGNLNYVLNSKLARTLGFSVQKTYIRSQPGSLKIVRQAPLFEFEAKLRPLAQNFKQLKVKDANVLLKIRSGKFISDAAGLAPWGGYVINPYIVSSQFDGTERWLVNPFQLFRQALHLQSIPVPDTTTLYGKRILLSEIDGDGFISKGEWHNAPVAGKIIEDEVIKKYNLPTSVSIIQGEIGPTGVHSKKSKQYENIAKDIFALPNVEIASHSYSHPFNWYDALHYKGPAGKYNLPIKGYHFNLNKEIVETVHYINHRLAPKNKHVALYLWTGEANPGRKALALCYKMHLMNMNGGNTYISNSDPDLFAVYPLGRWEGPYFQVFAPIINESIYTHGWTGPFWGFQRVIETFKLTDAPRRLKPIDIYYHFFSGTKLASLKALYKVYDWALNQEVFPIYASEFSHIVLDYNNVNIARLADAWQINTGSYLKELRVPKRLGMPDLEKSTNVLGFSRHLNNYYVHLGPAAKSILVLSERKPNNVYLYSSNARVLAYQHKNKNFSFSLQSEVPLQFTFANLHNCVVRDKSGRLSGVRKGNLEFFKLKEKRDEIKVFC